MLAQSPSVNSPCTALLILHVHSVSAAPPSLPLRLMCDMEVSEFPYEGMRFEQFPPTTVDNKSIRVLAIFLCQRWVESLLLINDWHMRRDIYRY